MATTNAVWGIDIGQCALKALRCEYDDEKKILVATAFDYIEHPKILSQPDANPKELVQEALKQFLERNDLKGDRVAVSVPGQSGLARFFEPPPVDMKRLPEIVKFEARQQIPFPLEEVIWDFQLMGGANEVEGFLMEAEVGLFAMKRDQVFDSLTPYRSNEVELDIIQLSPLCAYNFVSHNLMTESMDEELYDPDNPPESFVIVSIGTDTTDLVITNGFRVWQRNVPLGGNHFTKQLTKELKLTFAKAEHLKRHVREAEDAKSVIQAMRPVFNDLLTEVQRSIGFFQNIDRKAEIGGLIMLGNAVKLPGLQQYLAKNLGYELIDVEHEKWAGRLAGQSVLTAPQFKENMHAFGICYGLCLQGLGKANLETNLLPKEILTERIIRAKKPWALATAAALMLAFAVNFAFEYNEWYKVHPKMVRDKIPWEKALSEVDTVKSQFTQNEQADAERVQRLDEYVALGKELSGNSDRRLLWLELMKAINQALPMEPEIAAGKIPNPKEHPISDRVDIHVEYIESQYFSDLSTWFAGPVQEKYETEVRFAKGEVIVETEEGDGIIEPPVADDQMTPDATATPAAGTDGPAAATDAPAADASAPAADMAAPAADTGAPTDTMASDSGTFDEEGMEESEATGPSGPGWVIEIGGHHFFNADVTTWMGVHVRSTLMKNLREQKIQLPGGPNRPPEVFTMEELGIGYVILARSNPLDKNYRIPNPFYEGPTQGTSGYPGAGPGVPGMGGPGMGMPGMGGPMGGAAPGQDDADAAGSDDETTEEPKEPEPPFFIVPKHDFIVQFCWQEQQLTDRLEKRKQAALQQQLEQQQTPAEVPDDSMAAADLGG